MCKEERDLNVLLMEINWNGKSELIYFFKVQTFQFCQDGLLRKLKMVRLQTDLKMIRIDDAFFVSLFKCIWRAERIGPSWS